MSTKINTNSCYVTTGRLTMFPVKHPDGTLAGTPVVVSPGVGLHPVGGAERLFKGRVYGAQFFAVLTDESPVAKVDDGAVTAKITAFGERLQRERVAAMAAAGMSLDILKNYKGVVSFGREFARVDFDGSGNYMVDLASGDIYGIKAYGVPHYGYRYGTLDTLDAWNWGGHRAHKVAVPKTPADRHLVTFQFALDADEEPGTLGAFTTNLPFKDQKQTMDLVYLYLLRSGPTHAEADIMFHRVDRASVLHRPMDKVTHVEAQYAQ
jgi:hypothetical protein